jgi:serine/threonine-protein kinase
MQTAPVQAGDVLAGKYRVEQVLGVGGMGVVVAALHLQLDERVALKFLLPEALENQEAVARFAREARAAVKIKSEHVARVIDVGNLENGAPYMVMEYLEGSDLSEVLKQRGRLPIEEAVQYVLEASEALAEAHVLGIIHRDLKPSNLFLARRPDGRAIVKVLDFGISKVRAANGMADAAMTKTSSVMGSPLYMSPEQMAASRDVDARSDIWSLGAVLYQLLTCSAPFVADTMPELCAKILTTPATSIRSVRNDIPPELEGVVLRCLEKNREHRFPTVAHLAMALAPYVPQSSRHSIERISRVLGVDAFSSTGPAPTTEPMGYPGPQQQQPWYPPQQNVPAAAYGTHASWGTTGGPRNNSGSILLYVAVGVVAVLAAIGVVVGIAIGTSGSRAAASPSPVVTQQPTTVAVDTQGVDPGVPPIHHPNPVLNTPPPVVTTPATQTAPPALTFVLPTATQTQTQTQAPPTATTAPTPHPTNTGPKKPDIF